MYDQIIEYPRILILVSVRLTSLNMDGEILMFTDTIQTQSASRTCILLPFYSMYSPGEHAPESTCSAYHLWMKPLKINLQVTVITAHSAHLASTCRATCRLGGLDINLYSDTGFI